MRTSFITAIQAASRPLHNLALGLGLMGALLGSSLEAQANLITNGSFEQNNYFIDRNGYPRLDDVNGSTPTGWVREMGNISEYMVDTPYQGVTLYNAQDGHYFIGFHPNEWWEQSFATTAGTTYMLTYWSAFGAIWTNGYSGQATHPSLVTVKGDGYVLSAPVTGGGPAPSGYTLLDAPFDWVKHTEVFTADRAQSTLRFTSLDGFIFIDNVSVEAIGSQRVPEPGMLALLALGLPALARARRKQKTEASNPAASSANSLF